MNGYYSLLAKPEPNIYSNSIVNNTVVVDDDDIDIDKAVRRRRTIRSLSRTC